MKQNNNLINGSQHKHRKEQYNDQTIETEKLDKDETNLNHGVISGDKNEDQIDATEQPNDQKRGNNF